MTPKKVTDSSEALRLIENFKTKSTLSNCYLMGQGLERIVLKEHLWYVVNSRNAFFLEDKGNCFRIHYMINDENIDFPLVTDKPLMIEILFRGKDGEPEQVIRYWENQGFKRNLVRQNLTARYQVMRNSIFTLQKLRKKESLRNYSSMILLIHFQAIT